MLGPDMVRRLRQAIVPNLTWNQELYGRVLSRYVVQSRRWLDAGCGHQLLGPGLEDLEKEIFSHARYACGVDLDFPALQRHQNLHGRARAVLDKLPFASGTFDLVSCNMVVEHLPNPESVVAEFWRVLTPRGFVVIHTPNTRNYAVIMGRIAKTLLPQQAIGKLVYWSEGRPSQDVFPTYYRANSRNDMRRLAGVVGFSEVEAQEFVGPQPIVTFFAPVAALELAWMRACLNPRLSGLRTTLLAVWQKPA